MLAKAPSNIALIKYMGKVDSIRNVPSNPSLSLTLDSLCTYAEFLVGGKGFEFEAVMPEGIPGAARYPASVPDLNQKGSERILKHVQRVIQQSAELFKKMDLPYKAPEGGRLRSANTFPAQTGIASSASSFAAVTLVVAASSCPDRQRFDEAFSRSDFKQGLAAISRQGSGSSCRSFEGPYVLWNEEETHRVPSALPSLVDLVCIVSRDSKKVGSSEAHQRVRSSPLWTERVERVQQRLGLITKALKDGNLSLLSEQVWAEAWEMHSMFHTAQPPFSYFRPQTMELLQWLDEQSELPVVTLDAGPNVHILVPSKEAESWKSKLIASFPQLEILADEQGSGAELL